MRMHRMKTAALATSCMMALLVTACETGDGSRGTAGGADGAKYVQPEPAPSSLSVDIWQGYCLEGGALAVTVRNGDDPTHYSVQALRFGSRKPVKRWTRMQSDVDGTFMLGCQHLKKGHHVLRIKDLVTGREGEVPFDVMK